ncbi:MAG: ABC transporter permease subunit [Oscillospiraceae bacterium]|nr:ABC transporter permease subunit [Oscillospiraceae bacterium]
MICIDASEKLQYSGALSDFEQENPGIEVVYEIIPDHATPGYKPEDREMAISRLRTALMAGSGPDLFILRTNYLISFSNTLTDNMLPDIEKNMSNGMFCDLTPLFEQAGIHLDDYIAPVMERGRTDGRQYIVPLAYDVQGVLTNDITRRTMGGDAAFRDVDTVLDGILAVSEIPGAGGRSALKFVTGVNYLTYYCDPYYLSNPPIVDYSGGSAGIDTPLVRKTLSVGKTAQENIGDFVALASANPDMTLDEWGAYAGSDRYFIVAGDIRALAYEAGISERAGVTLNVVLAFLLALMLRRRFAGSRLFRSVILFPMFLPVAAVVTIVTVFFSDLGLVNCALVSLGLPMRLWLSSDAAFPLVLGLYILKNIGYNIILFLTGMNMIPHELYETADIEGAGPVNKVLHITIPLTVPTAFFVFIISVMNCFKSFREVFILGGDHPHESIYMLPHFINNNMRNLNYQRLSVASVITVAAIAIIVWLLYMGQSRMEDRL